MRDRQHKAPITGNVANETDFAAHVQSVEHRAQRGNLLTALRGFHILGEDHFGRRARDESSFRARQPGMHQEKYAHRKNDDERAEEQPDIQVQIPKWGISAQTAGLKPFHRH